MKHFPQTPEPKKKPQLPAKGKVPKACEIIAVSIHAAEHPIAWEKCSQAVHAFYMARAVTLEKRVNRAALQLAGLLAKGAK